MSDNSASTDRVREPKVSEVYPELFHYTSIAALQGILQSNTLWATRATHLNDTSELTIIWPMVEKTIIESLSQEFLSLISAMPDIGARFGECGGVSEVALKDGQMLTSLMRKYFQGEEEDAVIKPPYITSFTTHCGDDGESEYRRRHGVLSQWRAYAMCGGVAIVFDTQGLEELLTLEYDQFEYWPLTFLDVVYYDEGNFSELFPELAAALAEFLQKWVGREDDTALAVLSDKLAGDLSSAAGRLKHRSFREEQECRIVAGVVPESWRDGLIEIDGRPTKNFKKVYDRAGARKLTPYIRLFEELGANLPIRRVIIGPSSNQESITDVALELVKGREIEVQKSEIPFIESPK